MDNVLINFCINNKLDKTLFSIFANFNYKFLVTWCIRI